MAELRSNLLPVSLGVTGKALNMLYMFPIGNYFHEVYSSHQADFLIDNGAWRVHLYGESLRNEGRIQLPGPFFVTIPALAGTITSITLDRYLPGVGKFSQWTLDKISVNARTFHELFRNYENAKTTEALVELVGALMKGDDLIVGTTPELGTDYDVLIGFDGNDRIYGEGAGDVLLGMSGNDYLSGGKGNDKIYGAIGKDTLHGGTGADTMVGDDGSDTYYVDHKLDVVTETNSTARTGGTDTVYSSLSTHTLAKYIESGHILASGKANLTGNGLDNVLYAGVGNNVLNGSTGSDTVSYTYGVKGTTGVKINLLLGTGQSTGGSGTDTLTAIENLSGSRYNDTLTGNKGANILSGVAGNDSLSGGAGNDTLIGGLGKDALAGGAGNDRFDFNALSEMGLTSTTRDVITDFVRGHDKIDLATLDANTATPLNDAFTRLIGSNAAFTAPAQLKLSGGVLYGNTDADGRAEFAIQLTGISTLATSDLYL